MMTEQQLAELERLRAQRDRAMALLDTATCNYDEGSWDYQVWHESYAALRREIDAEAAAQDGGG